MGQDVHLPKRAVQERSQDFSGLPTPGTRGHTDVVGSEAQGKHRQADLPRLVPPFFRQGTEIIGEGRVDLSGARVTVPEQRQAGGNHSAIRSGPPTFCLPSLRVQRYTPGRNWEGAGMDQRKYPPD